MFGIILEVDLRVVPNERYLSEAEILPVEKYVEQFRAKVDGRAGLVYGRLCVVPGDAFLTSRKPRMFSPITSFALSSSTAESRSAMRCWISVGDSANATVVPRHKVQSKI